MLRNVGATLCSHFVLDSRAKMSYIMAQIGSTEGRFREASQKKGTGTVLPAASQACRREALGAPGLPSRNA
jgi:hypothetical protein